MKNYNFQYENAHGLWISWSRTIEAGIKTDVESYLSWLNIYHPQYQKLTSGDFVKNLKFSDKDSLQGRIISPSKLLYNQYYTTTDSKNYLLSSNGANFFVTEKEDFFSITSDTWYISNHLSSSYTYNLRTGDLSLYSFNTSGEEGQLFRLLERTNPYEGLEMKDTTDTVVPDLLNINSLAELKYQFIVTSDYGENYKSFITLEYPTFQNIRVGTTILCKNQPTSLIDKENNTSKFLKFFLADEDIYIPTKNTDGTYSLKRHEKGTKTYGLVTYLPLYSGNARWVLKPEINKFSTVGGSWSAKSYNWDWTEQTVSTDSFNIYNNSFAWTGEPIISKITTEDDGYVEDFIANVTVQEVQSVIDNCNLWLYNINMKNESIHEELSCEVKII